MVSKKVSRKKRSIKIRFVSKSRKKHKGLNHKITTAPNSDVQIILKQKDKDSDPIKWTSLKHNGPMFPKEYKPHNTPLIYKGKKIQLSPKVELYATEYAKLDSIYTSKSYFNKNFYNDWSKYFKNKDEKSIKNVEDCDFSLIRKHLNEKKLHEKDKSKAAKEKEKLERQKEIDKHNVAIVDGESIEIKGPVVEGPTIFKGRNVQPDVDGKIKREILPEDVVLNLGEDASIPDPPYGHKWGGVVNRHKSAWIWAWKNPINTNNREARIKYKWIEAKFKASSDEHKFNVARNLKKLMPSINTAIEEGLKAKDLKENQLASAMYFIKEFSLRVGSEVKKSSEDTDTVGTTSLKNKNVTLLQNNNIELDFLGKDSVRFHMVSKVPELLYKNLQKFKIGKSDAVQFFDKISDRDINQFLKKFDKDLSAKSFRTYNASKILSEGLNKYEKQIKTNPNLAKDILDMINLEVAKKCNHQKNVGSFETVEKKRVKIQEKLDTIDGKIDKEIEKQKKKRSQGKKTSKERENKLRTKKESLKIQLQNISGDRGMLSKTTAIANYSDPRILFAFFEKNKLDPRIVYSKNLLNKFSWARSSVNKDWKW